MTVFNDKTNLAFNAFHVKDYLSACILLKEAYQSLVEADIKIVPSPYSISKGLIILEGFTQVSEIELTDYLAGLIHRSKTILLGTSNHSSREKFAIFLGLIDLLDDLQSICQYWNEYLGGMNTTDKPSITVGLESKGQYHFYENIYEPRSMDNSKCLASNS